MGPAGGGAARVMRRRWRAGLLATPLLLAASCDQPDKAYKGMETKRTYSLCPKAADSKQKIYEQLRSLAGEQQARFTDRSAGAESELYNMGSGVLNQTGGDPLLVTVEKPNDFRISITNLGLREKLVLTVRSWGDAKVGARFVNGLDSSWTIREVEGGVTNDPPC